MSEYNNKTGKVTSITDDILFIDGDPFLIDTPRSKERMERASPEVDDEVEFNFHEKTGELIYLRVISRKRGIRTEPHSCGTFRSFSGRPVILPESQGEMAQLFYRDDEDESGWG